MTHANRSPSLLRACRILLIGCMAATLPSAALAEDPTDSADDSSVGGDDSAAGLDEPWEFTITPYGWLTGIDGTVGSGTTVDLDIPFSEVLSDLDFAMFLEFQARKGPWFIGFDGWGAIISFQSESDPRTVGFGPTTIQNGPLTISIPEVQTAVGPLKQKTRLNLIQLELVGGYRVLTVPLDEDSERLVNVDLYAGGRFWRLHTNTELSLAAVTVPGFNVSAALTPPRFPNRPIKLGDVTLPGLTTAGLDDTVESTTWWIDPIIGVQLSADVTDRIVLGFVGDIGGFAIGSASEFTWSVQGTAGYQLNESWTLTAGYRVTQINRGGGGFDGQLYGPVIGASYRWGGGGI